MRILLAAALMTLALSGCGGHGTDAPAPPPTPTHVAVQLDEFARQTCAKLDDAVAKRNAGDPTGANLDEFDAVTDARQSRAPGLQPLAGGDGAAAADRLRKWCYANARG